jgi:peptidoglycan hydrolase-like protein with peptidoglycan-binding domain
LVIKDLTLKNWKKSKDWKKFGEIWSGAALIVTFGVLGFVGWYIFGGGEDGKGGTEKGCEDKAFAFVYSKQVIKPELKYLSSPGFPQAPSTRSRSNRDVSISNLGGCTHQVMAWVDANNLLGARVRTYYTVIMQYRSTTKDWYHLTQYLALDQSREALRNKANKLRISYKTAIPPAPQKTIPPVPQKTIALGAPKTSSLTAPKTSSLTAPKTSSLTAPKTIALAAPKTGSRARQKTISPAAPKMSSLAPPKTISPNSDSRARSDSDVPVLNSKDSLKEIQKLLSLRGYDVGPIDGLYGSKVRKAISNFQSREGLKIDGQPSRELLKKLNAVANKAYLDFAAKSGEGPSDESTCRSYGGQPVLGQHYGVVLRMGRHDPKHSNIIYYGQYNYVTFRIDTETFWGHNTVFALCHFPG